MKKNNKLKVGVIGLGPVGMILAVKLHEAGCDVALCEVNETKAKKIKSDGLVLENMMAATAQFENVFTSISQFEGWDADYLFFALKSTHTAGAVKQAMALNTLKILLVSRTHTRSSS